MLNVIMPIYNGSRFLDKALGSIALQSLPRDEFKVTLVNDGGNETYEEYINRWSKCFDIEEMYMTQNMGCGFARQVGIDNTEGEYFTFIDADDMFMHPDALMIMVGAMEAENSDMVVTKMFSEDIGKEVDHNLIWMHGKCYRRSFVDANHIKFCPAKDATNGNEDIPFNEAINLRGGKITYLDLVTYYWRSNPNSLTRKENFAVTKFKSNIINRIWLYFNLKEYNEGIAERYVLGVIAQCYNTLNEWLYNGEAGEQELGYVRMLFEDTIGDNPLSLSDFYDAYAKCCKGKITVTNPPVMSYDAYLETIGVFDKIYMTKDEFDEIVENNNMEGVSESMLLRNGVELETPDNGD